MNRERIRERRIFLKMTQEDVGKRLGVGRATIAKYESGQIKAIDTEVLARLADVLECSPLYLLGISENVSDKNTMKVGDITMLAVLGNVKAGVNSIATEEVQEYYPIPTSMLNGDGVHFCLRVDGDSMSPELDDGDLVVVRRQVSVDSGSLGVFLIDGTEGVIKRVRYDIDFIELISVNPNYPTRRFDGLDVTRVYVVGKVIGSVRRY